MLLLGLDIGSSSIKAAVLDGHTGETLATAQWPGEKEMPINAPQSGWAEQDPRIWWKGVRLAVQEVLNDDNVDAAALGAIGISYQMHGLVLVDKEGVLLRPAIIWCDGRAVEIGQKALDGLGEAWCHDHLLNAPGNFTASKLAWVLKNEPELRDSIDRIMLPGDYIAWKLTGEMLTTVSGLSEMTLWDFKREVPARRILDHFDISERWLPPRVSTFGNQGMVTAVAAAELGLSPGIPVTYRAGDQPNNAFSLQVFEPGEFAATAGTSGVIYGIDSKPEADPSEGTNAFAHVNHQYQEGYQRIGRLLCVNGCGIVLAWLRRMVGPELDYERLNLEALSVDPGSEGVLVLPFGNGPERMLGNSWPGASIQGLDLNRHNRGHLVRGVQEGIAMALAHGLAGFPGDESPEVIRAGFANLFQSPVFRQTFSTLTDTPLELYETDGAVGAARGAGIGSGHFREPAEAFMGLNLLERVEPDFAMMGPLEAARAAWEDALEKQIRR